MEQSPPMPAASTSERPLPRQPTPRLQSRRASDAVRCALDALTAEEVALVLGCEAQHVNTLAAAHALPAVKFGRSWRFPAHALNAFINQQAMAHLAPKTQALSGAPILRAPSSKRQRADLSRTVRVA